MIVEYVLETKDLSKKYGKYEVLKKCNIHIPKGAIYGLIGKNGAGKTTLIRVITDLHRQTTGLYWLYGVCCSDKNINSQRRRVSAIIEGPSLYLGMSAKDNLIMQYKVVGMPSFDGIDELLELVGLSDVSKKKVKYFSLGMKQRLSIATALVSNPDFLILDEPINGLDPKGIIDIRELILELSRRGITILISSHYLDELSKVATHYGFISDGTIISEISADDLEKKYRVKYEIKVDNMNTATKYFDNKNIVYDVDDDKTIVIYDIKNISKIVLELAKNKCMVLDMIKKEETLENYYMNLIGGKTND